MKRNTTTRTGIDIGTTGLKIVRGVGRTRLETITHIGSRSWQHIDDIDDAAATTELLLKELGLSRKNMGRVSVNLGGQNTVVREVSMPRMNEQELRQALPFEARKYLQLDADDAIIVDGQVTNESVAVEGLDESEMSVVMAVTSQKRREGLLTLLDRVGIEPHVIDLEPLACLNALAGLNADNVEDTEEDDGSLPAQALLDLGGRRASLHITASSSGLLSRSIWEGLPPDGDPNEETNFIRQIATRALETLTFYRGRYRREVEVVYVMGGGALVEGRADALAAAMNRHVSLFNPLGLLAEDAKGREDSRGLEPIYATACGLCRWGDNNV